LWEGAGCVERMASTLMLCMTSAMGRWVMGSIPRCRSFLLSFVFQ
jgi:hypothetical protein